MFQLTTIKTTGEIIEGEPSVAPPSLRDLQGGVGGYIETVPFLETYNGKRCVAYCNEEGKLQQLPINVIATDIWIVAVATAHGRISGFNDILVGDVIIITFDTDAEREQL